MHIIPARTALTRKSYIVLSIGDKTTGTQNQGADLMRDRYGLGIREQELLSRFTENSKQMQDVRRQIPKPRSS